MGTAPAQGGDSHHHQPPRASAPCAALHSPRCWPRFPPQGTKQAAGLPGQPSPGDPAAPWGCLTLSRHQIPFAKPSSCWCNFPFHSPTGSCTQRTPDRPIPPWCAHHHRTQASNRTGTQTPAPCPSLEGSHPLCSRPLAPGCSEHLQAPLPSPVCSAGTSQHATGTGTRRCKWPY